MRSVRSFIVCGLTFFGLALSLAVMGCGRSGAGSPPDGGASSGRPQHVTMSWVGTSMLFFDQDTGNMWMYEDPEKPAVLIGRLESFDKPLVTPAMKAEMQKLTAGVPERVAPATPVAKAPDNRPVADKLNALPRNLWPATDENQIKRESRDKWLQENVRPGTGTFTGKLSSVSAQEDPKTRQQVVVARVEVEGVSIWGKELTLYVTATWAGLKPADVIDWKTGQVLTLTGTVEEVRPEMSMMGTGYSHVEIKVTQAELSH